ncbi:cytochrome P450 [Schizophyllum commune H4-8]|nr:cytochrome P450 [Schizophyllum commune H4-8]KAI5899073.1 cytochrome P450 [Schizophyllum commune H4-8]
MAPRTEPPSAGRTRKRFLADGNDAVALAASIAEAQEEKAHEKIKHHQEVSEAGQGPSNAPRSKSKSASRVRLKEKKAALLAQKAQTKKKRTKLKKQRSQPEPDGAEAPAPSGVSGDATEAPRKRPKAIPLSRDIITFMPALQVLNADADGRTASVCGFPLSFSTLINDDWDAMKSRRAANKTGVAARLRVPKRSRSTSSSASYASVSYIDNLSPDEYVQHLEKTREALRQFPEVPRSRSPSPAIAESPGKKKGKPAPPSLQDAVRTIIRASKGNPAYGGWHKLTTLLRTSTSIGKPTYIIRRSSLVPAEPPENGWPKMFKTPEESEAWLARREAERKINAWQLSIERDTAARPSKAPCRISNFDVSSYLPPSFPNSQVITSTPKPDDQVKVRRKPSPILPLPSRAALSPPVALSPKHAPFPLPYLPPSPPTCIQSELGSVPLVNAQSVPLAHAASSSSIPGLGLGPRASPTPLRGKRRRPATPEQPSKRARTEDDVPLEETDERLYRPASIGSPSGMGDPNGGANPSERKTSAPQPPTLTDLLSAKRTASPEKASPRKRRRSSATNFVFTPVTRKPPDNINYDDEQREPRALHLSPIQDPAPQPPAAQPPVPTPDTIPEPRPPSPDPFIAQSGAPFFVHSASAITIASSPTDTHGARTQGSHIADSRFAGSHIASVQGSHIASLQGSHPAVKQSSGSSFEPGQGQPFASFGGMFDPPFTSTAPDNVTHNGSNQGEGEHNGTGHSQHNTGGDDDYMGTGRSQNGPSSSFDDVILGESMPPASQYNSQGDPGFQYNSQLEFEDKLEAASRRIEEDVDPLAWLNDTFGSDQVDGLLRLSRSSLLIMKIPLLIVLTVAAVSLVRYALGMWRKRRLLRHVPGPSSNSLLLGNLPELLRSPAAEMEFDWQERYGGVVKYNGAFGEQLLMISDPVAAQYVVQTSGYSFIRPSDRKEVSRQLLGKGILTVEGHDHKRHRRIMVPGLSSVEVNSSMMKIFSFVSVFTAKAARCAMSHSGQRARLWASLVAKDFQSIRKLIHGLDALGEAAFDYHFNALDDDDNAMAKVYHNLLSKTRRNPSNYEIFIAEAIGRLPSILVQYWNDFVPNRRRAHAARCKAVAEPIARDLVARKLSALQAGETGTDVMSRLVQANASADPDDRLDEEELLAQLLTMILSGHETTANTLSWALYELCRYRDVQTRLRTELRSFRATSGSSEPSAAAFDGMPYLTAVVKETLRFHAPVYNTARTAAREDVVPLGEPIVDSRGQSIYEIPVLEGQRVLISIAAYNRNKAIFGPDADQYNPERWLKPGYVNRQASIGMYGNLLTFGGGHRGCLGWRFAVLELSAFLFELINRFDFAISPTLRVHRGAAAVMVPMLEGELDKGTQLPLFVRHAAFSE